MQENFLKNLQRLQPPYVDYDILDVRAPKWFNTKLTSNLVTMQMLQVVRSMSKLFVVIPKS